jgi:hypothetical protein
MNDILSHLKQLQNQISKLCERLKTRRQWWWFGAVHRLPNQYWGVSDSGHLPPQWTNLVGQTETTSCLIMFPQVVATHTKFSTIIHCLVIIVLFRVKMWTNKFYQSFTQIIIITFHPHNHNNILCPSSLDYVFYEQPLIVNVVKMIGHTMTLYIINPQ